MADHVFTNADFNAASRIISAKLEIYFDGDTGEPVVVTRDSFLVDAELIEEAGAESSSPFGVPSADVLSFTLYNTNNMFSPLNPEGPYFGKIKAGLKVKFFFQPTHATTDTWLEMGTFYVTIWQAKLGSYTANVTSTDVMQTLLNTPMPNLDIKRGFSFAGYIAYALDQYGYTDAIVDPALNTILPYGAAFTDNTKDYFRELTTGTLAILKANRQGKIIARKLAVATPIDTLTDANQIIEASVTQTTLKTFAGVQLTYLLMQISDYAKILDVSLDLVPGINVLDTIKFPQTIYDISAVVFNSDAIVKDISYTATNFIIDLLATLDGFEDITTKLSITGRLLTLVDCIIKDDTTPLFTTSNKYIQNASYAAIYKNYLNAFVATEAPTIEVSTIGNPLIQIGDTVQISSARYALSLQGILQRATYKYNGALNCTLVVLNAEVLE